MKKNRNHIIGTLAMAAFLILLVLDMCIMIRMPEQYMIQNLLILCALIAASLFSAALLKEIMDNKEIGEERYNNLDRSGKATYILLRRISEELKNMPRQEAKENTKEEKPAKTSQISEENIINAQKAAARVIVSRNQENIREIVNANNQILEKCSELEDKIDGFKTELLEMEKSIFELMRQDISDQKAEQLEEQTRLAEEIKEEIEDAVRELSSDIRACANKVESVKRPPAQEIDPSSLGESENLLENNDIVSSDVDQDNMDTEGSDGFEEDQSMLEGLAMLEEIEKLGNEETDEKTEQEEDTVIDNEEETAPVQEESDEEPEESEEKDVDTEPVFEKLDPPEIILPDDDEPDFSNPNKMMTPDEIAALLAKL